MHLLASFKQMRGNYRTQMKPPHGENMENSQGPCSCKAAMLQQLQVTIKNKVITNL